MRRTGQAAAVVLAVLAVSTGSAASAAVKPHGLFTNNMVIQRDMPVPVWGTADDGETVTVELAGRTASATAKGGAWKIRLEPMKAGGPFTMTIRGQNAVVLRNVMVGEVWVCSGQSNMAMPLKRCANAEQDIAASANPMLRLFTVERTAVDKPLSAPIVAHPWVQAGPKTTPEFSGTAYYFGRDLQPALKMAVGLIHTSWGGSPAEAWTDKPTLMSDPDLKRNITDWQRYIANQYPKMAEKHKVRLAKWKKIAAQAKQQGTKPPRKPRAPAGPNSHRRPSALYNGMIHPLLPYAIRGAIWYQGEGNSTRAYAYRKLFAAMITNWRKVWGQGDFPFLFVQLAPFTGKTEDPTWAELREAQLLTAQRLPNAGMAVITDAGDCDDIHPTRKAPLGARLALLARRIAYGHDLVASGPEYAGMKADGGKATLSFKCVGSGLVSKDGELKGFTVAGADRKFVPARAEIVGDKLVVSSPNVAKPVAVRYGWTNCPDVNLFNKEGLPATPFRTDDFPMVTRK